MSEIISFTETADFYNNMICPKIEKPKKEFNVWKKCKRIHTSKLFDIIVDSKWRDQKIDNLHLLTLCKDFSLCSIRDLRGKDLPYLESIYKNSLDIIEKKYKLKENDLNIYFHYYPGVWLLHLHFVNKNKKDNRKNEMAEGRAHFYDQVIENLKSKSNFYKKTDILVNLNKNRLKNITK